MNAMFFRRGGCAVLMIGVLLASPIAADDPPADPPGQTPFGRFLGELFDNIGNRQDAPAGQQEPAEPPQQAQPQRRIIPDAVDERALAGREPLRDLQRALGMFEQGEQESGVKLLHHLLDADEDTLMLSPDGQWESLQQNVEQLIDRPEIRQAYVEQFSEAAELQLQKARRTGAPRDYAAVTRRYLHTPAGKQAARYLARMFRDAGEPVESAYWNSRTESEQEETILPPSERDRVARQPVHQWRQPFGGRTHHGTFPATEPVLIERWSAPITVRPSIADQVDDLVRDLVDNRRACIPAAIPLVVEGRIVTRTLRGLSVFDADTGRLVWESVEGASVERLLTGEQVPRPGSDMVPGTRRSISAYDGANADAHPLTSLLFRDGVYGHVSSDGEQVFVLEDHASLSFRQPGYAWGRRIQDDPFDRDWKSNELVAYDLESGAVRWRIGGEKLDEPFDPPLAGTLFMGPPTVDGDELFVIGERGGTVSMHVLDRSTGQPRWSHPIATSGPTIDLDLVRRWWPAQPAVGAGVIVCPTTNGWLVAIDRLERRIRWAYRYIEARQKKVRSNRSRVASAGPLNNRWSPAAPIVTQRHVLLTPSELPDPLYGDQPRLVCLDLLTGERIWWKEKQGNLYVGGVVDDRVLLVGRDAVQAREIASGRRLWETPLEVSAAGIDDARQRVGSLLGEVGKPSGRGLIAGDEFFLPLRSGQLWALDIDTGEVTRTIALRDDDRPLGNLLVDRGRLISADPLSLRCFEERSTIADDLAQRPAGARLRAAELKYLEGDFREAHKLLTALDDEPLDPPQQSQAEKLRWDTLVQIVRLDLQAGDAEFAELARLATTDQQRLTVERTRADRFLSRGDLAAAFDVYWNLAGRPMDMMIRQGQTSVHVRRWLAGRLEQIWKSADDAQRRQFDERIRGTVDVDEVSVGADRQWWLDVLRGHPTGWKLREAVARHAAEEQKWTVAETSLLQLLEEADDDLVRLVALQQLVRLMLDRERPGDAAACLDQYADQIAGGELLHEAMADRLPSTTGTDFPVWSDGQWSLTRSAASFNRAMSAPVLSIEQGLPSVNQLQLRVESNLHRLSVEQRDGTDSWEIPLRAQSRSFYNQTTGIASVGQLLFVVHRGVLQAVSMADHELRWHRKFDLQSASGGHMRGPARVRQQELRQFNNFVWTSGLRQPRTPAGMLAAWRPGYVAYFGRHSITLADPLSGQTLWTHRGIAPRTMVYGTARTLFVIPPAPQKAYALRIVDGSRLELPHLEALVSSAVALTEGGLLVVEEREPLKLLGWGEKSVRVRLVDPHSGDERAETTFPAETRLAALSNDRIGAVDPDGAVTVVDGRTGRSRLLGSVGEEVMRPAQRMFAVTEPGRLYLAFNKPPRPGSHSRSYQSSPVNGTLAAFDIRGGLLWSEEVENQNLIVDQLPHLPVLVISSQRAERDGNVTSQKVFVELRDKQTGRQLLQDSRYIVRGNVRELVLDPSEQLIDLNTYQDRLRLQLTTE